MEDSSAREQFSCVFQHRGYSCSKIGVRLPTENTKYACTSEQQHVSAGLQHSPCSCRVQRHHAALVQWLPLGACRRQSLTVQQGDACRVAVFRWWLYLK